MPTAATPLVELLTELESAIRAGDRSRAVRLEQAILQRLATEGADRDNMERRVRGLMANLDQPAAGTLQIRIALVEAKRAIAGSDAELTGSVAIELEILDAVSGKRLVAVADSRGVGDPTREARDVRAAFANWARRARDRLATFRDFDAAQAALLRTEDR